MEYTNIYRVFIQGPIKALYKYPEDFKHSDLIKELIE